MLSGEARAEAEAAWRTSLTEQTNTTFRWLTRNAIADYVVRVGLYLTAGAILVRLFLYLDSHADPMARELLDKRAPDSWWYTAGAVTWPVLTLLFLAAVCVALGLFVHTRSARDFETGQEGISRLRRDGTGVPRARALTQMIEENVANLRRAFTLQLWLSRTLFVFALALLAAFLANALLQQSLTLVTGLFGISALASIIGAAITRPGSVVGTHLADLTQLQLVTTTAMRQIGLLEEHAYQLLEASREDPGPARSVVSETVTQMVSILNNALSKIEEYADPND